MNVSIVVVNHQGKASQQAYHLLKEKVSEHIPVYQQDEGQPDVWTTLNATKSDFLIYDRCGRLVSHLGLPYTFLSFPYVGESIKSAYCENKCGICKNTIESVAEVCNASLKLPAEGVVEEQQPEDTPKTHPDEPRGHGHRHHHQHHHNHERDHLPEDPDSKPHPHHHNRAMGPNKHGQRSGQQVVDALPQPDVVGGSPQREMKRPNRIRQ